MTYGFTCVWCKVTVALPASRFLSFHLCRLTPALVPSPHSSVPRVALISPTRVAAVPGRIASPLTRRPSPLTPRPSPLAPRPSCPTFHPRLRHPLLFAKRPGSSVLKPSHSLPCFVSPGFQFYLLASHLSILWYPFCGFPHLWPASFPPLFAFYGTSHLCGLPSSSSTSGSCAVPCAVPVTFNFLFFRSQSARCIPWGQSEGAHASLFLTHSPIFAHVSSFLLCHCTLREALCPPHALLGSLDYFCIRTVRTLPTV
jgi:hypothetical protein